MADDFKNLTEKLANAMSEQLMQMTPGERVKVIDGLRGEDFDDWLNAKELERERKNVG